MTCTWGISPSIVAAINKLKNSNSALGIRTLQLTRSARNRTLKGRYSYLLRSRLDFQSSMILRIENRVLRLEFRFSSFKIHESNFENQVLRAENIYSRNSGRDFQKIMKYVSSIAVIKIDSHPWPSSLGRPNINVCISGTLHPVSVFIFIKKSGHNACILRKLTKKLTIQYTNKFFKKFASA